MIKLYPAQLVLFALILMISSCKDEELTPACSEVVDLGIIEVKDIIPYSDFEVLTFRNQIGEEEFVSINHQQQLNWFNLDIVEVEKDSTCGVNNSIEIYKWVVSRRNAIITFGFDNEVEDILISERGIGEVANGALEIKYELSFSDNLTFPTGEGASFMNLTLDDIELNNPTPTEYEYYQNYNAGGFSFEQVFVNTSPADLTASQIIYNIQEGLIGFIDMNNNVWKLID